jgi:hypothetical protein
MESSRLGLRLVWDAGRITILPQGKFTPGLRKSDGKVIHLAFMAARHVKAGFTG